MVLANIRDASIKPRVALVPVSFNDATQAEIFRHADDSYGFGVLWTECEDVVRWVRFGCTCTCTLSSGIFSGMVTVGKIEGMYLEWLEDFRVQNSDYCPCAKFRACFERSPTSASVDPVSQTFAITYGRV